MLHSLSPERAGVLLCLLAGATFALQPVLVRLAFDGGAGVASVGAVRFALAAGVLALLARRALVRAPRAVLLPPFVLGLTLYGLETGLFFASLERIDVSLASLLMCGYPALVVAGAVLLRREQASRRRVAALAVALAGVALVLAGGVGGALDPLGIALALSAAVAYAAYVLVSDRLLGTTPPLVLATMLCAGAAVAFGLGGATTGSLQAPGAATLGLLVAIALVATVLPVAAFLGGVRRIGPSRATILGTVEPPVTIGLSALVFAERLGPVQLLGAGLVVSAVVILQLRRRPQLRPVPLPAPRAVPLPGAEPLAA
ncbi:MAG TPA: DMT family transporter [Gaiellaceae bacterium]|nr:DMT family transporter [Gaiellaceae bacterium]